jgi:hypothetical protein
LLESKGYKLLAACHLNEEANEILDDDGDGLEHGALTHYLLKFLRPGSANLTHPILHRKIQAKIQHDYPRHTPIFAGNSKRIFFCKR